MSDNVETKTFSAAEQERLVEVVTAAQHAVTEQDKFVLFLRKQHNAPVKDGWNVGLEGFTREREVEREQERARIGDVKLNFREGVTREREAEHQVQAAPTPSAKRPKLPKSAMDKADEIATNILYPNGVPEVETT